MCPWGLALFHLLAIEGMEMERGCGLGKEIVTSELCACLYFEKEERKGGHGTHTR